MFILRPYFMSPLSGRFEAAGDEAGGGCVHTVHALVSNAGFVSLYYCQYDTCLTH